MWSTENQEVLWKACENFDGFFSLFSWIFLTILSKPNRPKVSLAGLRMVSTSSCKNFRFFGHPSEKLCPFYGRYLKLCSKNDRDEKQPYPFSFVIFFFVFFWRNRRRKTRKQCWLGLWRDQRGDGGGARIWIEEEHNATSNKWRESTQIQQCRLLKEGARLKRVLV